MELTNEQKAIIFAIYYNCDCIEYISENATGIHPAQYVIWQLMEYGKDVEIKAKLLLTPLDKISHEDAQKVIELSGVSDDGFDVNSDWYKAVKSTGNFYNYFFTMRPVYVTEAAHIYQFLISRQYAVPIYPYNKTAIELGIAIDRTRL